MSGLWQAMCMAKRLSTYERQMAERMGNLVREQRETRNISHEAIADILGDKYDAVAKKEAGKRQFSASDIARLALEWNCTTDLLIFGTERPRLLRRVQVQFAPEIQETPDKSPVAGRIIKSH